MMRKIFVFCLFMTACHLSPQTPVLPPTTPNYPIQYINPNSNIPPTITTNQGSETPGSPGLEEPNAPNTTDRAASRTNELPYNLTPDFMTALTCSNNIIYGNGYYNLSLSSYYEGLQLSKSFKQVNQLDRVSQNQSGRILQTLNQSPLNRAIAELSIRDRSDPYSFGPIKNNDGRSIAVRFPSFNNGYILQQLSRKPQVLSTRPVGNSRYNSSPFRATLNPLKNSTFTRNIAPNLSQSSGNLILTLLYHIPQQREVQIPISDAERRPYGKSYTLDFNSGRNIDYLTNVYEEELQSSRQGEDWICPSDLRFMVHKNENSTDSRYNKEAPTYTQFDLAQIEKEGYCNIHDKTALSQRQKNFLSLEFGENERDWPFSTGSTVVSRNGRYVKLNTPCIVIRRAVGSCYNESGFYRIEFDTDWLSSCKRLYDLSLSDQDYENVQNAGIYRICPAWLSMCYKPPE